MENLEDLYVIVKEAPDVYTKEEWENQYGLLPMAFADLNEERE